MQRTATIRTVDVNGKKLLNIRPKVPKYRVLLSIDGGGVRGAIPATILQGFERCVKEVVREQEPDLRDLQDEDMIVDVADCFDTIAGNSVGSILALYFASGGGAPDLYGEGQPLEGFRRGSADGMAKAFDVLAQDIFTLPWRGTIPIIKNFSGLFATKYTRSNLEKGLRTGFGDLTLKDLKKSAYIPAYEMDNARPCAFWCRKAGDDVEARTGYAHLSRTSKGERMHSLPSEEVEELGQGEENPLHTSIPMTRQFPAIRTDIPLRIVAQASSSAPIFFPQAEYDRKEMGLTFPDGNDTISWVDGGMVSNNPTLQALFFMSSTFAGAEHNFLPAGKLAVLSIGTGSRVEAPKIGGRQGLVYWGSDLVGVLMGAHTQLNSVLVDSYFFGGWDGFSLNQPDRYIRINKDAEPGDPDFEALGKMDDLSKMPEMKDIANRIVEDDWDKLKEFVKQILMAE